MKQPDMSDIIAKWPTLGDLANDAGVSLNTAKAWRLRKNIPGRYFRRLLDGAKARKLPITTEILLRAAEQARNAA